MGSNHSRNRATASREAGCSSKVINWGETTNYIRLSMATTMADEFLEAISRYSSKEVGDSLPAISESERVTTNGVPN